MPTFDEYLKRVPTPATGENMAETLDEMRAVKPRFYLAGNDSDEIRSYADGLGVPVIKCIYQQHFATNTGTVQPDRLRDYLRTNVPTSYSGYIHFNLEHPRLVGDLNNNSIPADDPNIVRFTQGLATIATVMRQERPDLTWGNWGVFSPKKWVDTSLDPAGPQPHLNYWGTLSEEGRQNHFNKFRNLSGLWDIMPMSMPHWYDSYDDTDDDARVWFQPVTDSWLDASVEVNAELFPDKPVLPHINCRFGGAYKGRRIPNEQMWNSAKRALDAGWAFAVWGIESANYYYRQSNVAKRSTYRAMVAPELIEAGIDLPMTNDKTPPNWSEISAHFRQVAIEQITWLDTMTKAHV